MSRQRVSADRPWARVVGYSRAVRVGNVIEVSGTAPSGPGGEILASGDVYGQTRERSASSVRRSKRPGGRSGTWFEHGSS